LMGGEIHVESAPGKGSHFWFTVKLRKGRKPDLSVPGVAGDRSTCKASISALSAVPGSRILIAEDNEINQMVAQEILKQAGHVCKVVNNGRQAVEQMAAGGFDLVLMDCQMPEMDGFEATQRIRQAEGASGRHIPIVALTANAVKGDRERCLAAGMDDYISKPFDPPELLATIGALLGTKQVVQVRTAPRNDGGCLPKVAVETPSAAPPRPLDIDSLLERCLGNVELVQTMLEKFKGMAADKLAELSRQIASNNASEASRVAHALKGSAANMSAGGIAAVAAEIEKAGRSADLAAAERQLERLREEIERCNADIQSVAHDLAARVQKSAISGISAKILR
jgi:CheY-like chemotaxis protein